MSGPLTGYRIVDVSAVVSGPLATMILADQGADVVKVEPHGLGDFTRQPMNSRNGMTALYANCNRGKRSIVVDVKADQGRQIVLDLVAQADVFVENWRPGAAERLGLGEAALRALNPDLIYASVTGYGSSGPYSSQRVYDPIIQALTGMIAAQKAPDAEKYDLVRNIVADKASSYTLVQAITAALLARERGHGGQCVRVPMLDATLAFFWPDGMMHKTLLGDGVNAPLSLSDLYRVWETADGHVIAFVQSAAELTGLANALEQPQWLNEPGFTDVGVHLRDYPAFIERVQTNMLRYSTRELMRRFIEHEVPVAPVLSHDDVFEDPQIRHNDSITEERHPIYGAYRQARPAARFSVTETSPVRAPALHGEHTDEVLAELGYSGAKIKALRDTSIVT